MQEDETPTEPAPAAADAAANDASGSGDGVLTPFELPSWVPEPIHNAYEMLDTYPLVAFAVLVVLAYVVAKVAQYVVSNGVRKLTEKTPTDLDDHLVDLTHRPIFLTLFLGGLAVAIRSLDLHSSFTNTTIRILQSILVLVWLGAGVPFSKLLLERFSRLRDRWPLVEERTIPLFDITAKILLFGGASYAVLLIWNIDPTAWLASAGVVGLAVGFAAKDTLANLFAGFFIIADAPYKIGDFIILDSGERGRVTHVGIRSSRLETRDDIEITVPNATIGNAKIINESGGKWERERIRIKVGVAYGSDVDQVCEVLQRIALDHEHICEEPEPRVRMRAFGDSSLDFELLCWIDEPVLRGKLTHLLLMDVYKTFQREDIEIPFPKRDVYLHQMPTPGSETAS